MTYRAEEEQPGKYLPVKSIATLRILPPRPVKAREALRLSETDRVFARRAKHRTGKGFAVVIGVGYSCHEDEITLAGLLTKNGTPSSFHALNPTAMPFSLYVANRCDNT